MAEENGKYFLNGLKSPFSREVEESALLGIVFCIRQSIKEFF